MPAPWGANQPPWLCKGQKGQCTTRWLETGHRADEAVGFVSYVFGVHPAWCHPPVELLHQHRPGPPLGLPTELTPFEIYPVFGLAMPLHLMCSPKYEKHPLNTTAACPLFLWAEHLSPSNESPSHAHQFRWTTISSTERVVMLWFYTASKDTRLSFSLHLLYILTRFPGWLFPERISQDEYSYMVLQRSFLAETAMFPNA